MKRVSFAITALCAVVGCRQGADEVRAAHPPAVVVDSALAVDSLLQRFQATLEPTQLLRNAAPSREVLTRRYLDALARSDTNALRALHISRAEYAYLYFPTSRMMKPPYELSPEVAWLLLSAESGDGLSAALRKFGGRRFALESVRCPGEALREGSNVIWRECVVRYRSEPQHRGEQALFAAIIERDGQFKFFSYAN